MYKKILFPLLFVGTLFASETTYSQTNRLQKNQKTVTYNANVDKPLTASEMAMINEVYGSTANKNILTKPQRLKDIKNILRNRVEIKEISNPSDQKKCTLLSEVPLMDYYVYDLERDTTFNPNTFNPLKYLFNFYAYGSHMYRVDNTNYFIIIKSQHQ